MHFLSATVALYSGSALRVFHADAAVVMSARDAKRLIIASILHLETLAAAEDDDEIRAATLVICARSRSQHTHSLPERSLMVF